VSSSPGELVADGRSGFELDRIAHRDRAGFHGRAVHPEPGVTFPRYGTQDGPVPADSRPAGNPACHHGQMTQDQPETPREQLARQAVDAYNELTAHAEELSPASAHAIRSLRETLTSLVALGTAADLQIADMERTMEEFEAIFYSGDVAVSARLLRRHMTAEQRAELARLITED
jgi:hypothetical protein